MSNTRNRLPPRLVGRMGSAQLTKKNMDSLSVFMFPFDLRKKCSETQSLLLDNFEETMKTEIMNRILLTNVDFSNGTYRIKKPGIYILSEDIVFNPTFLFPQKSQKEEYPTGKNGAYHLGFFAAITVECHNVIIDLNGYSIKQSKRHNLLQRFFSIIELASSPFIQKQGPHAFTDTIQSANTCLIMNGSLLNSSHHGVHGNNTHNIVLYNLDIHDFEVAGIALNGSTDSVLSHCNLKGRKSGIPVLSSFSQAFFTTRILELLSERDTSIYTNLDSDLQTAYQEIMSNLNQSTYFYNKTDQYDGNMYGIVLNVNGIVINDFLSSRDNLQGNTDILVYKVSIDSIESHPVEIVALSTREKKEGYGGNRMVGVFGDVFDIEKVLDNDKKYNGNSLSDAQLYLTERYPGKGTLSISNDIVKWSKNEIPFDSLLLNESDIEPTIFVPRGDSMGHIMKGNIGIFISGGTHIVVDTTLISGVRTRGKDVGSSSLFNKNQLYFQGSNTYGILTTASKNIEIRSITIKNIESDHPLGISKHIEEL